jgi:hypothetical protein
VRRVKRTQHLEVFEDLPQGVRAKNLFEVESVRKLRRDKAFKPVERSTESLCIE